MVEMNIVGSLFAFAMKVSRLIPYATPFPRKEISVAMSNIQPTDSVLDVGCGDGILLNLLNNKVKAGVDILPLDNPRFEFHRLDLNRDRLPFPDRSFDVVACVETLEHATNLKFIVSELVRVAKKTIIVTTPNARWQKFIRQKSSCVTRHLTMDELAGLFEPYGFYVHEVRIAGRWGFIMPSKIGVIVKL